MNFDKYAEVELRQFDEKTSQARRLQVAIFLKEKEIESTKRDIDAGVLHLSSFFGEKMLQVSVQKGGAPADRTRKPKSSFEAGN